MIDKRRVRISNPYSEARGLHAFLLRCEGLKYRDIALALGVSTEQARKWKDKGSRRMRHALRNAHFRILRND